MSQFSSTTDNIARRAFEATTRTATSALQNMAVQDYAMIAFHAFLWLRVSLAPNSADASFARKFALALFTITTCTIVLTRGEVLPRGFMRALAYRVGMFTPMVLSYFELRWLLPALQPKLLDDRLLYIDNTLFGITPAVWLSQFNVPHVVEWFAFFYYSYFWILALTLVPSLFFDRGRRFQEVMAGAMLVCGLGHTVYTFVPGLGPYAAIHFAEPLHGGFFWNQVRLAVDKAGAMLDIFPSLHTAYPTFFALHAFGNRHRAPNKYLWPVYAFFAANIVIATMFLRWHWGIDIIAGLTLAFTARRLSVAIARREETRGIDGDERQLVWEKLFR